MSYGIFVNPARRLRSNEGSSNYLSAANELGDALKTSFKLTSNPLKNPRTADEWEPYLSEKRGEVESLSRELKNTEAGLNRRVYNLFSLTPEEIKLLEREVEH